MRKLVIISGDDDQTQSQREGQHGLKVPSSRKLSRLLICMSKNAQVVPEMSIQARKISAATASELVDGKVLREDVFQCLSRNEEFFRVVLTREELLLQAIKDHSSIERFSIDDLFGCHTLRHKKDGINYRSAYVCFYLYPRSKRTVFSSSRLREKVPLVFEIKKAGNTFQENFELAASWKKDTLAILGAKYPKSQLHTQIMGQHQHLTKNIIIGSSQNNDNDKKEIDGSTELSLNMASLNVDQVEGQNVTEEEVFTVSTYMLYLRRFLVILNPKSGQGKSINLFQEKVSPIFTEAGVKIELLVTEWAGHARSMMSSADFSDIDAIVTVGGDGLLYEVVNGLRSRPDFPKFSNLPVGVIAGGSGNGLARSIAWFTGESDDYLKNPVLSTTLAVARGKVLPMNLVEVDLDDTKLYSFLSVGWGLMSDIDIESEVLRAVGEARFTLWALVRIANLRTYKATLTYVPTSDSSKDGSNESVAEAQPVVIEDEFLSIYAGYEPYIGTDMFFSPESKPNDGRIFLTYMLGNAGRAAATQYLLGIDKGTHMNVRGVHCVSVKEFTISNEDGGLKGKITVDGELVKGDRITCRMTAKPLNVLAL